MCVYVNPPICHAIDLYVCGCVTSIEPKLSGTTLHICARENLFTPLLIL